MKYMSKIHLILIAILFSCQGIKEISETTSKNNSTSEKTSDTLHPFDSIYNSCSFINFPLEYRYFLNSNSPTREFQRSVDSVLYVKAGENRIGTRSSTRVSWVYWEDLNQCYNLGFFDNKSSMGNRTDEIPSELDFTNFPELRYMRSHSMISKKHLDEILATAKKLKGLDIYLEFDLPNEICNCEELEYLEILSYNSIKLPDCIKNLENLKYIRLIGFQDDVIWETPSLEALFLDFGGNLNIPDAVSKNKNLRHLSISGCNSLSLPETFGELDSLELLELTRIHDTISIADQLNRLKNLQGVKFIKLSLEEIPFFLGSNKLKFLEINYLNYLSNPSIDITAYADSLEAIVLGGIGFRNNSSFPTGIEKAKQLKYLHLYGFPIDSIPQSITELENLESLMLYGNNLSFNDLTKVYGKMHKQGLRYFNPSYISGLSDDQRRIIQGLDSQTQGTLSNHSSPPWMTFGNAFDYYRKKIKLGIETEWTYQLK